MLCLLFPAVVHLSRAEVQIAPAQGFSGADSAARDFDIANLRLSCLSFLGLQVLTPVSRMPALCFPPTWISEEFLLRGGRSHRAIAGRETLPLCQEINSTLLQLSFPVGSLALHSVLLLNSFPLRTPLCHSFNHRLQPTDREVGLLQRAQHSAWHTVGLSQRTEQCPVPRG